jgi:hypothetical protein
MYIVRDVVAITVSMHGIIVMILGDVQSGIGVVGRLTTEFRESERNLHGSDGKKVGMGVTVEVRVQRIIDSSSGVSNRIHGIHVNTSGEDDINIVIGGHIINVNA